MNPRRLPLLALALVACPEPEETGTPQPVLDCPGAALELVDANTFSFTGTVDVPSFPTVSGADVEICWDAVTEDIRCHAMDPAGDVDNVGLVRFGHLSEAEVEAALAADDLQQEDMSGYLEVRNDDALTCARLSEMSFFGTEIDLAEEYVEGSGTYMLLLTSGTTPGVGARMLAFLAPSTASDVTRVEVPSGCGVLDFAADLEALAPVPVCAEGPWPTDWSDLTVNGQGNAFDEGKVDGLMVGFYEGWTVADLEDRFLDLEQDATGLWRLALIGGTSADLADATDAGGAPFPGFAGDGAWVLALTCSRCANPAPLFLTILEPETAE